MKTRIILFLSILLLSIAASSYIASASENNLYRNEEFQFRIKFPLGWEVQDGDSKRIIKKAVDVKNFSSIVISAIKLPGNIDIKDFSQKELDELLGSSIQELKTEYPDLKIYEKGFRHLNNKKAIFLKYSVSYKTLDKKVDLVTIQYITIHKSKYYSIGGAAPFAVFNSQEKILNRSIASFVFEDGARELESFSKNDFLTYRDDQFKFLFQYPKSWSPVSTTHKNTRIKIVNENGSGDSDCGVNVHFDASLKKMSPKEFVASISSKTYEEKMRSVIPDATVIKSGTTFLGNQEGFYAITKSTFRSFEIEVPMEMLSMQTLRNGYIYTVSCRTRQDRFDEMMPFFKVIISGFLIIN